MLTKGFPPIVDDDAACLVLGTMPGVASVLAGQYYAHPRNAFWPIMGELFGAGPDLSYLQRQSLLLTHQIAVWDVLRCGYRSGSLDANIDLKAAEVNDFLNFFTEYPGINRVFFNGGVAEKLFRQRVMPILITHSIELHCKRLPSTSPAYATLGLTEKVAAWRVALVRD